MLTVVTGGTLAFGLLAVARRQGAVRRAATLRSALVRMPSAWTGRAVSLRSRVDTALARADLVVDPSDAFIIWMSGTLAAAVLALSLAGWPALGCALAAGAAAGPLLLWSLRHRFEHRLRGAVPDLLDDVSRELRAGGTVASALERVSRRTGPVGREVATVVRRHQLGLTVSESLACWAGAHEATAAATAVSTAALALQVAVEAGGRSAAPLEALAGVLRDQAEAESEARAQAAQGRVSALLLGVLPVGSVVLSAVLDPDSADVLLTHPLGRIGLVTGLVLDGLGLWWMRRIVRVAP